MVARHAVGQFLAPQDLQLAVASGWAVLDQQQAVPRIWEHDATLWKSDPAIQEKIKDRLGWLSVVQTMQEKLGEITTFVEQVRRDGYTSAVLLGMGGSSLCPEVLRFTFGSKKGYLDLFVLDTTDPDTLHSVELQIDLATTLFIVASKSGSTIETLSHYKYFFDRVSNKVGERPGEHFIAITDPDSSLAKLAHEERFRHVFVNPPDIGGRYSALSYFGLVPGALIGLDLKTFLTSCTAMIETSKSEFRAQDNPGLWLGAILGALGKKGRDKVTFIISPEIASFGYWIEQLLAESTGKEGRGLVPIEGETPGAPEVYGKDRLFVYLRLEGSENTAFDAAVHTLQEAGHPVVLIDVQELYDLGAEFFRWELATAVAGMFLDINPFDEPNVQESKDNTRRLLDEYRSKRKLPEPMPVLAHENIQLFGKNLEKQDLADYLHTFLDSVQDGDYIAIMAYVERVPSTDEALQALRLHLRNTYKVATTIGYGPRFLHSTGQLHKGGANNGIFIQVTGDIAQDASVPGEGYTFGVLKNAQALGDLFSLESHQRRVVCVNIKGDLPLGLQVVEQSL